jgi:rifampicin phosphotransferase
MRSAARPRTESPHVAWLHGPSAAPDAELGGKAANLRRLARAGFRVPPGACVTAAAQRARLGPERRVEALVARLPDEAARAELAELVADPPLEPALAADLAACARELAGDGGLLAVRSSALGEDGRDASHAGRYESLLGVRPDGVADAVRAAWASLWSPEAVAYRARLARPPLRPAMAVLVQRLVAADAAAVAFSADPLGGAPDRVVVEAAPGLGPPLVAGGVGGDRFSFARPGLAPLGVEPGDADVALRVRGGELALEPVARAGVALAIDADAARALAELALDAEAVLGFPVDLEAARAAGEWHVLQARPITTA